MKKVFIYLLSFLLFHSCNQHPKEKENSVPIIYKADIIVYGGTSSAVIAAVQAARMDKSVFLVSPDIHLGGLSSGGLGWTDSGNKAVVGGLAREFYQEVYQHYKKEASWVWQKREEYGNRGQEGHSIDPEDSTMWIFEPHVAEQIFDDFIEEHNIKVYRDEWLDRENGVNKKDETIESITTLSGKTFHGTMFIDATYEGDLMAAAGVSYHVGREANSVYDETWNGVQVGVLHHKHFFKNNISPYIVPGNPDSGLLPRVSGEEPGKKGEGDHRVQAYCFRLCMTKVKENQVPITEPEGYDPYQYELLVRIFDKGWKDVFGKFDPIPNYKTDVNNRGPFSTDNIGMNYDYPEASYERRKEIINEHRSYQQGLFYFIATDPRVPEDVQLEMKEWGLAKDEFQDNDHWPHQLYVREARRMTGEYVMTEHDVLGNRVVPNAVGMGSYTLDSHNTQRYIKNDGFVQNEGDIGVHIEEPYQIALGSLLPKKEECANLLVPVCASCSHIAYGSIRMEPVFMILGQSAATVAAIAIEQQKQVHEVPYSDIEKQLVEDKQVLAY